MTVEVGGVQFMVEPHPVAGDAGFWRAVSRGSWEPYTFAFLRRWLTRESTYFDVGAWVGPTVLYAAHFASKCFAYEPDPTAFAALTKNLSLNPHLSILPIYAAVSDATGCVSLGTSTGWGDSMSCIGKGASRIEVPSLDFGYLLDSWAAHRVFVKMDIEGGEAAALHAMGERRPTLLLSVHMPEDLAFIRDVLGSYKHLLDSAGRPIAGSDVSGFDVVLATDEELP